MDCRNIDIYAKDTTFLIHTGLIVQENRVPFNIIQFVFCVDISILPLDVGETTEKKVTNLALEG